MKTTIENLDKLSYLSENQKAILERQAAAHLRYSNISFKIMTWYSDLLIVQTSQGKHISENYADEKRLIELTQEMFNTVLYGRTLRVGAKPFIHSPSDVVSVGWIKDSMSQNELKASDLEILLGIDKSTLSLYLTGKRELSRGVKAMFFYFFNLIALDKSFKVYK